MKRQSFLTIVFISAFSFMLAIAIHEQVGHGLTTILLGGRVKEANAFYIDTYASTLTSVGHRLEALAGPAINIVCAVISIFLFRNISKTKAHGRYFLWHFSTVNLMIPTGYLIFSGITGLGDLGFDKDGALHGFGPEGLVRIAFILIGFTAYYGLIRLSIKNVQNLFGGRGEASVPHYQKIATVAYAFGVVAALLVGVFNPNGLIIIVLSVSASSIFGTSGLLWMMQLINRKEQNQSMQLFITQSMPWITISASFVLAYGLILARSIYF